MHKHYETGADVSAPEPVARAKNLVEEFFGLPLSDGPFYPHEFDRSARHGDPIDQYQAHLTSPTGRALERYTFAHRREDGWVTVKGEGDNAWVPALQIAINNFVNRPQGAHGVLGEWRPTAEKLKSPRD